ncbi:MAG: hypothetical protein IJL71_04790, partial [Oscillospiraceae bacterium]|nr:hypothetical protein [Oscillospiraceae bacterium]
MKKKLLSLMLALVMVLGMVPLGGLALAADGSPVFAVTAPANKTIEATAEKQEIGKPAYTVDSSISTVAVGVKYTKLTSGDNSIGLVMSGTRTGFGDSAFNSVSGLDGGGLPVIYVAGESADIQEERELTFYAQANSSDLASAAPGTYTATLTYIFWITPNDGGRLTREQTRTLTLVIPEPYTLTAPANKTIEATAEKQEIGKPAFTADSTVKDIAVGVKYTMLTSGDKSIGLTISGKNQLIGEEAFEPRNGESVEGGMPIIYVASDSADVQAKRELTIYAQANSADLADAAPGTYTATLTYVFWITPKEGKSITEERTQTLTLVVPEPAVTEYPLWVGETQVTSANKGDILGDQSASFDPETNTLTFTVEQPAITGLYQTFKIYAFNMDLLINTTGNLILNKNSTNGNGIAAYNHDVTINGNVDITAQKSCITAKNITVKGNVTATGGRVINADPGSVTIDGDAKLTSTDYGIWANTDITVTGSVDASAKTGAVYAYGNVTIGGSLNAADAVNNSKLTSVYAGGDLSVGGDVTVKNKENYDYGIVSMTGKITVGSGRWEAEGFRGAMWAKKGIIIPQTHLIHVPENGSVGEADLSGVNGYSVLNKDGETAKRAVIERVVEYPLWLGETRV